jgi:lipopolysaccharide export system protein LptA
MRVERINILSATALLSLYCAGIYALPSDPQQPIVISADQMVMDQKNFVSRYSGRVKMIQGGILIEAEELIVYTQNKKLHKLEVFGSDTQQAEFRQQLKDGTETRARAGQMEYRATEAHLVLKQQAELKQRGNHIQGERIDYNTASNNLIAGQNREQSPATPKQRVRIVIEPDTRTTTE